VTSALARRHPSLALLLLAVVLTAVAAWRVTPFDPGSSCCDHLFYRSMSYNLIRITRPELNEWPPGLDLTSLYDDPYHGSYLKIENKFNRQPPYVYRVVSPLAARLIARPLDDDINRAWRLLSFSALVAATYFVARVVLRLSGDLLAAVAAALAFSLIYWLSRYHQSNYMLVEPLQFALIGLGIWLMLRREQRWFFVVAAVAVLNKETGFLLLASHALMALAERRLTMRTLAIYAAITLAYLSFVLLMPVPNDDWSLRAKYVGLPALRDAAGAALNVFGVLAFFALSRVWFTRFACYLLPFPVGVFLISLFATGPERYYVYAFPFVLLAVFAVRARDQAGRWLVVAPAIAFAVLDFARPRLSPDVPISWHFVEVMVFALLESVFLLNYAGVLHWTTQPLRTRRGI
jgi:hypothetical protein